MRFANRPPGGATLKSAPRSLWKSPVLIGHQSGWVVARRQSRRCYLRAAPAHKRKNIAGGLFLRFMQPSKQDMCCACDQPAQALPGHCLWCQMYSAGQPNRRRATPAARAATPMELPHVRTGAAARQDAATATP